MTLRVIGILLLAILFILPAYIVKHIVKEDEINLNTDVGKIWVFATHLTIPYPSISIFFQSGLS